MSSQNPGCLAALFGVRSKPRPAGVPDAATQKPAISAPLDEAVPINEEIALKRPYHARGFLLTKAEAIFYHLLRDMVKGHLVIFPHVALRDLVTIVDRSDYFTYYNKIDRKQMDFVLCDPGTLQPIFVIELDDSSHNRPDRMLRDAFVEVVLESAKIPLVRVPVKRNYDQKELGELFRAAITEYMKYKSEFSSDSAVG